MKGLDLTQQHDVGLNRVISGKVGDGSQVSVGSPKLINVGRSFKNCSYGG